MLNNKYLLQTFMGMESSQLISICYITGRLQSNLTVPVTQTNKQKKTMGQEKTFGGDGYVY